MLIVNNEVIDNLVIWSSAFALCYPCAQKSQKAGREYTNIKYSTEAVGGGDVKTALSKTQLSAPGTAPPPAPGQPQPAQPLQPRTPTLTARKGAPPRWCTCPLPSYAPPSAIWGDLLYMGIVFWWSWFIWTFQSKFLQYCVFPCRTCKFCHSESIFWLVVYDRESLRWCLLITLVRVMSFLQSSNFQQNPYSSFAHDYHRYFKEHRPVLYT